MSVGYAITGGAMVDYEGDVVGMGVDSVSTNAARLRLRTYEQVYKIQCCEVCAPGLGCTAAIHLDRE